MCLEKVTCHSSPRTWKIWRLGGEAVHSHGLIFNYIFSNKKPSRWGDFNLDYIVDEGDQIYISTVIATALLEDELPLNFRVADCDIRSDYLAVGISYFKDTSLWITEIMAMVQYLLVVISVFH